MAHSMPRKIIKLNPSKLPHLSETRCHPSNKSPNIPSKTELKNPSQLGRTVMTPFRWQVYRPIYMQEDPSVYGPKPEVIPSV